MGMSPLPLSGVRVLDFSWWLAAPHATQILGAMGAEVIRVESRQRLDRQRRFEPWADDIPGPNRAGRFNSINYSKRSCTLNLTQPEAVELAKKLALTSDVVVEGFSYGVIDRLGLGYKVLRKLKPDLIMLSFSILGRTGPDRNLMGFGPVMLSFVGLTRLTSYPGERPHRVGGTWPDYTAGIAMAFAVLAAIYHRQETGQGQYLDFSLGEATLGFMPEAITDYTMNAIDREPQGNRDDFMAPHGVYRCRGDDQWVALAVGSDEEWKAFCQVAGHPEWEDEFGDAFARWQNQEELDRRVSQWTRERSAAEAADLLQGAGIAASPCMSTADLLQDPHLKEREAFVEIDHPEVGKRRYLGLPWKLSQVPNPSYRPAPLLGEDNGYVFGELLGLSSGEMRQLEEKRVIY